MADVVKDLNSDEGRALKAAADRAALLAGKLEADKRTAFRLESIEALKQGAAEQRANLERMQWAVEDIEADVADKIEAVKELDPVKVDGKWYVKPPEQPIQ